LNTFVIPLIFGLNSTVDIYTLFLRSRNMRVVCSMYVVCNLQDQIYLHATSEQLVLKHDDKFKVCVALRRSTVKNRKIY